MQRKSNLSSNITVSSDLTTRFRKLIKDQNMTQKSFCLKTGISTGHLSKVLTGNAIPSGAMLFAIAKEGYDVNYILTGSSCKKELFERDSEIEKLELIVTELRNIININLKK